MNLLCRLGWHRADQLARWNNGYYFSKCVRCGQDLVRTAYERWHVPSGYRVVWQPRPPQGADTIELPRPAAPASEAWHQEMERSVQGAVEQAESAREAQPIPEAPAAEPAAVTPEPAAPPPAAAEEVEATVTPAETTEAAGPAPKETPAAESAPVLTPETETMAPAAGESEAPAAETAEPQQEAEATAAPAEEPSAAAVEEAAASEEKGSAVEEAAPAPEEAAAEPARSFVPASAEAELPILEVLRHLNDSEIPGEEPEAAAEEAVETESDAPAMAEDPARAAAVPAAPLVAERPAPVRVPVEGDDDFMAVDEEVPAWVDDMPAPAAAAEAARRRDAAPEPGPAPQAIPAAPPEAVPAQDGPVEPTLPYDAPAANYAAPEQEHATPRSRRPARSTGEIVSWIAIGVVVLIAILVLATAIASAIDKDPAPKAAAPASPAEPSVAAAAPDTPAARPVTQTPQRYEYITATFLNCRAAPSKEAEPVRRFARGERVGVLAREGSWLSIAHRGRQCWAADKYISAERPL